ncbi:MAG TPA: SDR family NAD(P)-dependent oxidoreductase, partial [Herpetosiphonaceae bacterium]|nr:SDR family NAD(P)-dependent oxidoreductase [Herpetosiphonaceae bacterium]
MSYPATLLDLLHAAATDAPHHVIVHVRPDGTERVQTYRELRDEAERVSAGLRYSGLEPGSPVIVLPDRSEEFLPAFWGALLAGLVPVPLARETDKLLAVAAFLDWPPLIVDRELATRLPNMQLQPDMLASHIFTVDNLLRAEPDGHRHEPAPSDLAYLQFSSGSTGQPKGVELTHANILANVEQIIAVTGAQADDISVSWMPYVHDMGLVCTHLVPLAARMKQVKIGPLHFVRRPAVWFEVAHRHQATILIAANFALMLVLKRVRPELLAGLDLRAVRILANGSEPVSPRVCRAFLDLLAPCGLQRTALLPVYGLAEVCVGATFPPRGMEPVVHSIDREALVQDGRVVPADARSEVVEIADLGFPLPGFDLRITDGDDRPVEEGTVGHIQVRGPNVMHRYHRVLPGSDTFCDGWLRTGDQGFLIGGRLSVTGRTKDVIVVSGRKHHAHDLEEVVRQVPGVRLDTVAVCSTQDAGDERVVVFVALETAHGMADDWASDDSVRVLKDVARAVQQVLGREVTHVLPLRPREFPRTTSGKLQRYKLRTQYEAGAWNELARAVEAACSRYDQAARGPRDELSNRYEAQVRAIWARVLGRRPADLRRHDDFRSLGGTSLQAMEVLVELEALVGRSLEPAVLLERPTIADLADFLRIEPVLADGERGATDKRTASRSNRGGGRYTSATRPRFRRRAVQKTAPEPLAVVGMACRFPGASSPEQFWANLASGVDSVTEVPPERWPADQLYDRAAGAAQARSISKWGAFLDDVAGFDAAFFEIDPDEAAVMDPQQRILMEVAYEALERAGYAGERRTAKRIGVFVGVGEANYGEYLLRLLASGRPLHPSAAVGNLRNLAAARIARALGLTGPVMAVDTACSSALVALHLARQSILLGECDLAVVGAANLNLTATPYLLMSQAGALSPTGRCRAFDAAADGFVPGEGAGAVVLVSLADAEHEGDRVIGLVRGTAINNDGRSISPMAPNPLGQQAVLAQAYRDAGVAPESVSYIEAHGTGTPIGDPIEVRSLHSIFPPLPLGALRPVGSVKTNIGHLLNAAGMPGLIKVLLQFEHRQLVPSLHYHQTSPRFDLAAAGLEIPSALRPWIGPAPLRAGINGFGFGGTNAHVILEEPPRTSGVHRGAGEGGTTLDRQYHLLNLSARTEAALCGTARALAAFVDKHPETSVADLCFSASTARDGAEHRAAAVIHEDPREVLVAIAERRPRRDVHTGTVRRKHQPRVAFLFSGQGAQYAQQGRGLYETEPAFAQVLDACAIRVGHVLGRPLLDWCYGDGATDEEVARTAIAQPLLVAFEVALAQLVIDWGLRPSAVVGHSIGEVAAAAVAGILPVEEALLLARERGRLMDALPDGGAMAAVFAPESTVRTSITRQGSEVTIAALNGPREVVVAGSTAAVDEMLAALHHEGIATKRLRVSHAFHSPLMAPMLPPFAGMLQALAASAPKVPFFSTVRDGSIDGVTDRLDAAYWLDHVTRPVLFAAAIERLLMEGYDTFVEIGPGSTLCGVVGRICAEKGKEALVQPLLRHGQDDERSLLEAIGRLWTLGTPIDRIAIEGKRKRRRLDLPTYPFQHVRYWVPDVEGSDAPVVSGKRSSATLFYEPVWLDESLSSSNAPNRPHRWLLIPDRMGVAQHICDMLHTAGEECEVVSTRELGARMTSSEPYGIVHLGGCGIAEELVSVDALDRSQQQGVLDLLALAQTIAEHPPAARPAGLWVVSCDAYTTGQPAERPAPERATLAGLAQALPDECPGLACHHIDLQSAEGPAAMAAVVARELRTGIPEKAPSGPIAWRGGRRLARTLRRMAAPEAPAPRSNGIYLVTGGATGIGAELARILAKRDRTTLVLLGRTPLADAPARATLVAELEAMGATAEYLQADIGEPAEVEAAIAHIVNEHGPIAGVVHAAGVVYPGLLSGKTADHFAAVLRPKVRGTWLLLHALRQHKQQLDFFVACSSLASVMPGLGGGLVDYVAANAFLDAMAGLERAAGRPFTSINWSVWAETGMGAQPALLERMRARGFVPLSSDDAAAAFTRAIGSPAAQVVIADIDPAAKGVSRHTPEMQVEEAHSEKGVPRVDYVPRPQPVAPAEDEDTARQDPIHHLLQRLVAGALHIDATQVPIDESFMALGLDSLVAVELVKSLERHAACPLPLTLFFEHTTIRELAVYLRKHAPAMWNAGGMQAEMVPARLVPGTTGADDGARFELTPVQKAFLVNHELYPDVAAFSFLRQTIRGPLSAPLLLEALLVLEARHAML